MRKGTLVPCCYRTFKHACAATEGASDVALCLKPPLTSYELPHDKTNKVACAPNKDSVQPGLPLGEHEESLSPYLPTERTAKTLIRLRGCPG